MAFRKEELSSEDLAAFDLLINYLSDTGQTSMNLREFMFNGLENADKAWDAAKQANKERDKIKDEVNKATAILSQIAEGIDPDDITLGQLNQDISLDRLIEIRRNLEQ
jgi:hypothetical protein